MEYTRKIKLTIDARMIHSSGIGTYMKNIIPFLVDIYDVVLLGEKRVISEFYFYEKVIVIECSSNIYSIKEQFELFNKIPKCDFFWSPHYNIPLLPIKAKKRIVTIHDVFHLAYYDSLSLKQKVYVKLVINQAVKKSDAIITDSIFSKNEIKKYTGYNTKNIIGCSINKNKFKLITDIKKINFVKSKYQLPDTFLLFIGNVKPHKNLKNLLLAIKSLNVNLVIVGKRDGFITGDDEIEDLITNNKLKEKIYFTGYAEDNDIPIIYSIATLFVFPSLYEGFGIPPIEAQACGCPVICSNAASLKEVGGDDSVLYVDPYDVDDIIEKILMVLKDDDLKNNLRQKGFENIKRFSWEESARKIEAVMKGLSL